MPSTDNTENDLDAGGKTKAVEVAQKAEAAGIDPTGKTTDEVEKEISTNDFFRIFLYFSSFVVFTSELTSLRSLLKSVIE